MKKGLIFTCSWLFIFVVGGQSVRRSATILPAVLNGYSNQHATAFNLSGNPASIAGIQNFGAGVFTEKRFLLNELSLYKTAMVLPTGSGSFGLSGNYFGNTLHKEGGLSLAFGKKLGALISAGVQFNYISLRQQGYAHESALNAEAGILFRPSDQFTAGLHAYNPASVRMGKIPEERLPSIYSMGFCYEPSAKFYVAAQINKIEDQSAALQAGIAYHFEKKLQGKIGFDTGTATYYFSLGVQLNQLKLETIASVHPQLGVTPALQLLFERKNAANEKE